MLYVAYFLILVHRNVEYTLRWQDYYAVLSIVHHYGIFCSQIRRILGKHSAKVWWCWLAEAFPNEKSRFWFVGSHVVEWHEARYISACIIWCTIELSYNFNADERSVRRPIETQKRVAIGLYKLASSAEYRTVAELFGVGISSVRNCLLL